MDHFSGGNPGHLGPEAELSCFAVHPNLRILGSVPDLTSRYDSHRIFVAPTHIAGGVPYKLHETASVGIPIVATELLGRRLEWVPECDLLAAPRTDSAAFAGMISRPYLDRELCDVLLTSALDRVAQENSAEAYADAIRRFLELNS